MVFNLTTFARIESTRKSLFLANIIPFPWTHSAPISRLRMSSQSSNAVDINNLKRKATERTSELHSQNLTKKPLLEKEDRVKRRKVAMLISYLGLGYLGLQRNPGIKTIEEDLMVALLKAGYINQDIFNQPQLIQFQRAARTDKGVSALRQTLSLKLPELVDPAVINEHLPDQIRVIGVKRATKNFNSKGNCDGRTYSYTSPTFAFSPQFNDVDENYRIPPGQLTNISQVLRKYEGTHNFHNFTSRKLFSDPSAKRYIMNFTCEDPFRVDDMEFVTLKVKGQSFMLHQIRKMVGLAIAIVKGMTDADTIMRSWEPEKLDIPIAPGLGLLLEEVHYDRYNYKFGKDGMHDTMEWKEYDEKVEKFNKTHILPTIVKTEKKDKSMTNWLESLKMHSFDVRTEHIHVELDKALEENVDLLVPPVRHNLDTLIAATRTVEEMSR